MVQKSRAKSGHGVRVRLQRGVESEKSAGIVAIWQCQEEHFTRIIFPTAPLYLFHSCVTSPSINEAQLR